MIQGMNYPNVKKDVYEVVFSKDTASETYSFYVSGTTNWEMNGKRNGRNSYDQVDEDGSGEVVILIYPRR